MAEAAVNIVVERLSPLLIAEGALLRGVHSQIKVISSKLELIKAYVKDAEKKAERGEDQHSESVKVWVKQVREVSYRIEDVIDKYMYHVGRRRQRQTQRHGLVGVLCKICDLLVTLVPRHEIASEIEDIKGSIATLNEMRQTLGLNPLPAEPSNRSHGDGGTSDSVSRSRPKSNIQLGALYADDSQLVGVDSTRQRLMYWLRRDESMRAVICVVGEGGLGKTTIVKNIYEKQKENGSFDFYAWITVSHSLKDEKLLEVMIKKIHKEDSKKFASKSGKDETMDKETLTMKVKGYLQERRRYIIVFDDVWETNFWTSVQYALPDNKKSSRIMMATRNRGVGEYCTRFAPVHSHHLEPLSFYDALTLFHRNIFHFDPQGCPEELTGLSREFVNKCNGVPLAIEAIAGLLSTKKKNISEWKKVHDSLRSRLAEFTNVKFMI